MTATVDRKLHQFTVDEYERMIAAGVFDEVLRIELIGGELVEMAPIVDNYVTMHGRRPFTGVRKVLASLVLG